VVKNRTGTARRRFFGVLAAGVASVLFAGCGGDKKKSGGSSGSSSKQRGLTPFAKKLRESLGKSIEGKKLVVIDKYDSNHMVVYQPTIWKGEQAFSCTAYSFYTNEGHYKTYKGNIQKMYGGKDGVKITADDANFTLIVSYAPPKHFVLLPDGKPNPRADKFITDYAELKAQVAKEYRIVE